MPYGPYVTSFGSSGPDPRINELLMHLMADSLNLSADRHLANPLQTLEWRRRLEEERSEFQIGTVIQPMAALGWYSVAVSGRGFLGCCCLNSAAVPVSTSSAMSIPPRASVLLWLPSSWPFGVIIGLLPPTLTTKLSHSPEDRLSPEGRTGLFAEHGMKWSLDATKALSGVFDFSIGRPTDSTSLDYLLRSPLTGMGLTINDLEAHLGCNELASIAFNFLNNYVKIGALNGDWWSGVEQKSWRAMNRLNYYRGIFFLPRETIGRLLLSSPSPIGQTTTKPLIEPAGPDDSNNWQGPNPVDPTVQPFARWEEYSGWDAQGYLRLLKGCQNHSPLYRPASEEKLPVGLWSEHVNLEGGYLQKSAKFIAFVKTSVHPVPVVLGPPGDHADRQEKTTPIEQQFVESPRHDNSVPSLTRAAAIDDFLSFVGNWQALTGFHYSADYRLPQASDMPGMEAPPGPSWSLLMNSPNIQAPQSINLKIDHRYAAVAYNRRTSSFVMHDDGSIIFTSAGGARLILNEHVRIEGADIELMSARRLLSMAGEMILRAHRAVDIDSANSDLRINANKGLQLGGDYILLDARNKQDFYDIRNKVGTDARLTGITLKAHTNIVAASKDIYLRSGVEGRGDIFLDSANQEGQILLSAKNIAAWCTQSFDLWFGGVAQSPQHVATFSSSGIQIDRNLQVVGDSILVGNIYIDGQLGASGSVVSAGTVASRAGGLLAKSPENLSGQIRSASEMIQTTINQKLDLGGKIREKVDKRWRQENRPGQEQFLKDVGFSWRDDPDGEQYRISTIALLEPYWQQCSRLYPSQKAGRTWNQPTLLHQGQEQMPWPGKKAWTEENILYRVDQNFLVDESGVPIHRDPQSYHVEMGTLERLPPANVWMTLF